MNVPCKNCTERKLGCHAVCKAYREFDKSRKELSQKRLDKESGNYSSARARR